MSIERVKAYFGEYGMEERVREFPVSSATVELAAEALGCEPCRIAKTLSFMTEKGAILVVAAVNVYLDVSLRRFDTVFPACGSSNSAIELTIPELEKYSGCRAWVDVCKGYEEVQV